MKIIIKHLCFFLLVFSVKINAQPPSFTIFCNTGPFSITCANPTVDLVAVSNYTLGTVSYSWTSVNATSSGSTFAVTNPGAYTVTASVSASVSSTQTLVVGINTTAPSSVVTPTYQTASCVVIPQPVTLTATNPTSNVTHKIMSPLGGTFAATSSSVSYQASAMGQYSCVTINDLNGCSAVKNFTLNFTQGPPIFNLNSAPANFTLGCATKSAIAIHIDQAQTTTLSVNGNQIPLGGPVSYSIIGLGSGPSLTVNSAGTWTVSVKDNSNGCETRVPFTVTQNTVAPPLDDLIAPTYTLTCNTPWVEIKAVSLHPNVLYDWSYLTAGGAVNEVTNTIWAVSNTATPTGSITNNYTLTLTDIINACQTKSVITIYQNIFPPSASISCPSLLFCDTPAALQNSSSSNIPAAFSHPLPVTGFLWEAPPGQISLQNSETYFTSIPGTYTLTALDNNNGCKSQATISLSVCVGLQEHPEATYSIVLQPNPCLDYIDILLQPGYHDLLEVELLSLTGQKIRTLQHSYFGENETKIHCALDGLGNGTYFLRIGIGKNKVFKKLVVAGN